MHLVSLGLKQQQQQIVYMREMGLLFYIFSIDYVQLRNKMKVRIKSATIGCLWKACATKGEMTSISFRIA